MAGKVLRDSDDDGTSLQPLNDLLSCFTILPEKSSGKTKSMGIP